jgi:hypothetical protein
MGGVRSMHAVRDRSRPPFEWKVRVSLERRGSSQTILPSFLLAERARGNGARPMRAVEGQSWPLPLREVYQIGRPSLDTGSGRPSSPSSREKI